MMKCRKLANAMRERTQNVATIIKKDSQKSGKAICSYIFLDRRVQLVKI